MRSASTARSWSRHRWHVAAGGFIACHPGSERYLPAPVDNFMTWNGLAAVVNLQHDKTSRAPYAPVILTSFSLIVAVREPGVLRSGLGRMMWRGGAYISLSILVRNISSLTRWSVLLEPEGRRVAWAYLVTIIFYHLVALLAFLPWFFSWTEVIVAWLGLIVFGTFANQHLLSSASHASGLHLRSMAGALPCRCWGSVPCRIARSTR